MDDFFKLSGLKISVSKTKAIWFGSGFSDEDKLCSDLGLDWSSTFRLLGIDFDNKLECMDANFDAKINEIEKLFNCWMYRNLSIYGKTVIIKSLALSKLSHLALVLPRLDKKKVKRLECLIYSFLWGNKVEKVCRADTKLSEKAGGLGLVDVVTF